jgi:hypothetical protein
VLRNVLLAVCLVLVAIGGGAWLAGSTALVPLFAWGSLVLVALLFERWRYRPETSVEARADEQGWQATGERFIDPDSGRLLQVYFHAKTGERRYQDVASGATDSDRP